MTAEGAPETAVGMAAALRAGEVSSVERQERQQVKDADEDV